jgi:outer membrane receptor for monomeric catechols
MKKLTIVFVVLICIATSASAQFGEIRGVVTDKVTGELLPGAAIIYSVSGVMKGTTSDEKGEYKIKPLVAGSYNLEFSYVMYKKSKIDNIAVSANKTTYVNIVMESDNQLPPITVRWEEPLIDPEVTGSMTILTPEEIDHAVERDIVSLVANTAGAYQKEEGGSINIRGSRGNATIYVVDGVRMQEGFSIPKSAIAEVTVLTGGIPAQFGDATGGVVLITTKSFKRN